MEEDTPPPNEGFSGRLKILVISFVLFTFLLFGVFFAVLIKKIFDSSEEKQWEARFEQLGDRLKENGLNKQAIRQYENFLNQPEIGLKKRAEVSFTLGKLHMASGNCGEALVWFFQTEMADKSFPQKEKLNSNIKTCLDKK